MVKKIRPSKTIFLDDATNKQIMTVAGFAGLDKPPHNLMDVLHQSKLSSENRKKIITILKNMGYVVVKINGGFTSAA